MAYMSFSCSMIVCDIVVIVVIFGLSLICVIRILFVICVMCLIFVLFGFVIILVTRVILFMCVIFVILDMFDICVILVICVIGVYVLHVLCSLYMLYVLS